MTESELIGIRLLNKIRLHDGDIVFLESGQYAFIRATLTSDALVESHKMACEQEYKTKDKRFFGNSGILFGKIINTVRMLEAGEQKPTWVCADLIDKPATFPMTDNERKLLNER